jgi:N6-L-threonylcarbamoyladenine synthase
MSFSGIKTAVVNLIENAKARKEELSRADIAASFQTAVNSTLTRKALLHCAAFRGSVTRQGKKTYGASAALSSTPEKSNVLALAGGVCANKNLREMLERECAKWGISFFAPAAPYRTDNAAMIGAQAFYQLLDGKIDDLTLSAYPQS